MSPYKFPQCNINFGPPPNMTDEQVATIPAHRGVIQSGSCEGHPVVVVAKQLTKEEIEVLQNNGGVIFMTTLGNGLAPHFLSLSFDQAVNPL